MQLRRLLDSNAELARKLSDLERSYDGQFKVVFDAIRQLMSPPSRSGRRTGFRDQNHTVGNAERSHHYNPPACISSTSSAAPTARSTPLARDPKARLKMHNAAPARAHARTSSRVVYSEACESLSIALKREHELKQWPRAKKRELMRGYRRRISMSSVERPVKSPEEKKSSKPNRLVATARPEETARCRTHSARPRR